VRKAVFRSSSLIAAMASQGPGKVAVDGVSGGDAPVRM
jgi:hypothetical protein